MTDINTPMTDERLAEIRQHAETASRVDFANSEARFVTKLYVRDITPLLAEVERQRAALAQYEVALGHAHESADFRAGILRNERESLWQISRELIAENAAMRPIVEAIADVDNSDDSACYVVCDLTVFDSRVPDDDMPRHNGPCIFEQARAFVTKHPARNGGAA